MSWENVRLRICLLKLVRKCVLKCQKKQKFHRRRGRAPPWKPRHVAPSPVFFLADPCWPRGCPLGGISGRRLVFDARGEGGLTWGHGNFWSKSKLFLCDRENSQKTEKRAADVRRHLLWVKSYSLYGKICASLVALLIGGWATLPYSGESGEFRFAFFVTIMLLIYKFTNILDMIIMVSAGKRGNRHF